MSTDRRTQEEKDALLALYERQACTCGHLEGAHSDGLADDPARLCAMCAECEGFTPKLSCVLRCSVCSEAPAWSLPREGDRCWNKDGGRLVWIAEKP